MEMKQNFSQERYFSFFTSPDNQIDLENGASLDYTFDVALSSYTNKKNHHDENKCHSKYDEKCEA